MGDITQLLGHARAGAPGAKEALFTELYGELRMIAASRLSHMPAMTMLDPAALVHEAYLRVREREALPEGDRNFFLAYAGGVMRHIVIDALRQRSAVKRGGEWQAVTLSTRNLTPELAQTSIEKLNDAIEDLHRIDRLGAEIVEMRFFAGFGIEQIAEVIGASPATVKRHWQRSRAFLLAALSE